MDLYLLVFLAFGLAMDAFAVSVTNGMCYRIPVWKNALTTGLAFGFFQGVMPIIGFIAGHGFSGLIMRIDHWVALVLLSVIGGKMIVEATAEARRNPSSVPAKTFTYKTLMMQSVATSIDALAVGVGLGVMQVNIYFSAVCIAVITFFCCVAGVLIGKCFGGILKNRAEIIGGVILILIGVHIFTEHASHTFHQI
ncbi:MAG: manganese efflux pump MntP family protein [Oscillospiraceae bacterium]|nr:manganese efflux pump MntP family protein [Oscillospiraceae bacterium]